MISVEIANELKPLIARFLENRHNEIAMANAMLERRDFVALHRYGHSLKGACMGYGFTAVIPIADEIQAAAKAKTDERIRVAVEKVSRYFADIQIRYKS